MKQAGLFVPKGRHPQKHLPGAGIDGPGGLAAEILGIATAGFRIVEGHRKHRGLGDMKSNAAGKAMFPIRAGLTRYLESIRRK